MSTTLLWALPMSITAVCCEFLYRRLDGPWSAHWWLWMPINLVMGYLVYRVVTSADSLLAAFIIGNFVTSALRIVVTVAFLREHVSPGTWVGFGLLVLANVVRFHWR